MNLQSLAQFLAQYAGPLANHLWQSTLFAAVIALFTLAFRKTQARIRFMMWLAASLKFLIPFALLVALGARFATPHAAPAADTRLTEAMVQVTEPFPPQPALTPAHHAPARRLSYDLPVFLALAWLCGFGAVLGLWLIRWRRVAMSLNDATPLLQGREVEALRRLEELHSLHEPIPFLVSADTMEPGVFGIARPVLLWPEGISSHLEDEHLRAILAHEVGHVRRRDNLTAALHMVVEAVFWFHPLVWWLGSRLIAERERACDEGVLHLGNNPSVYAESILKACKFCVESPLPCVSGVSGSNLKRRIVRIMNQQLGKQLTASGKFVLAALSATVVATPLFIGVVHAPQLPAQEPQAATAHDATLPVFDKLSVKPSAAPAGQTQIEMQPGAFIQSNATLKSLIAMAYGVQEYQITGVPDWAETERFDIEAHWKPEHGGANVALVGAPPPPPPPPAPPTGSMRMMTVTLPPPPPGGMGPAGPGNLQAHEMLRALLAQKFNLKISDVSQNLPVYNLVVSGNGSRLTPAAPPASAEVTPNGKPMIRVNIGVTNDQTEFSLTNASPDIVANLLAQQVHRQVIDKTGLTGRYDVSVHWPQGQDGADAISAALEDQLGLRLQPSQAPVAVLVINQVERPAAE